MQATNEEGKERLVMEYNDVAADAVESLEHDKTSQVQAVIAELVNERVQQKEELAR